MQNSKVYDLKKRAFLYSIAVIEFLETLSKDYISQVMDQQLLRSVTSIGANIVEAQAASSKKDFANFYNTALKSANESKYWFLLLKSTNRGDKNEVENLLKETEEISNILAKSLLTISFNFERREYVLLWCFCLDNLSSNLFLSF